MNKNINRYYPIAIGYKRLLPSTMVDILHHSYKLRRSGTLRNRWFLDGLGDVGAIFIFT
ncbi:MAG: hypothetical protein IPQ04_05105 [Saprospiraceae bacterium]|nr:hypothetical protein [Saprospiraceae bacterium]